MHAQGTTYMHNACTHSLLVVWIVRIPCAQGTIEPFVNNGFPTRSGKSLKLETLNVDD